MTTTITDDSDPVTATLTATPSTSEQGGSITYTVTLTSGLSPFTPTGNLDFTLANGEHVIVQAGQASGSTTISVNEDDVYIDTHPVTNSIVQPYRRQRVREPGHQPGDGDDDDHEGATTATRPR